MRLTPYRDDRTGLFALQERVNRLFDSFFGSGEREPASDFVMDIIETPEMCDPDDPADQVLGYAQDVVSEYIRKRASL